jgi:hypothetical protein
MRPAAPSVGPARIEAENRSKPAEADKLFREVLERIAPTGYLTLHMEIRRDYASFLIDRSRTAEARPLLKEVRSFYDTPATPFERQRTDGLLQRCVPVPR